MSLSPLSKLCRQLQLSGISTTVDKACGAAARQQQPHHDFLWELLQQESEYRNQRRTHRRVKETSVRGF